MRLRLIIGGTMLAGIMLFGFDDVLHSGELDPLTSWAHQDHRLALIQKACSRGFRASGEGFGKIINQGIDWPQKLRYALMS